MNQLVIKKLIRKEERERKKKDLGVTSKLQ
jgi:hypothetical protein